MEKLIEIISNRIKVYAIQREKGYQVDSNADSKVIIGQVLSAVRDGRLDEELGVVGRHTEALGKAPGLVYRCSTLTEWEDQMARQGATTIIALRKEGQEEGGCLRGG